MGGKLKLDGIGSGFGTYSTTTIMGGDSSPLEEERTLTFRYRAQGRLQISCPGNA
jgi:hypothetical protein